MVSRFTKATVRSSWACHASSLSCCLGTVVDREAILSPAVCTRCSLAWHLAALRKICRLGGFGLSTMWIRPSLALAQAWRRAVPFGFRGLASVKSIECGGMDNGGENKAGKHVEVPLPMHGVAGKYAAALYKTAVRRNALDPVRGDLEQVAGVAAMNKVFASFMRDRSVPKPVRVKACEEIFKETKFHEVTKNFMAVLAENGRLQFVQSIFSSYGKLLLAHRGEVEVQVTTALELMVADLEEIKKSLGGLLKGQNAKITQQVDRSIIGGIVVTIGDKIIDLSIARQIKMMEKLLAEPV